MAARDPFRLIKAISIGIGLGFIVVIIAPHLGPVTDREISLAPRPAPAADGRSAPAKTTAGETADIPASGDDADAPEAEKRAPLSPEDKTAVAPDNASGTGSATPEAKPNGGKTAAPEPVLVPAVDLTFPKPFSRAEMTQALQPILGFRVSEADAALVKDALGAASRGQTEMARATLSKIADPAGRKLVQWKIVSSADAPFAGVQAFAAADPRYPLLPPSAAVERALFFSNAAGAEVLRYFPNRKAATGPGKAALGRALMEAGERERGLALVRLVWARHDLDADAKARFLERFESLLSERDHQSRTRWLALKTARAEGIGQAGDASTTAAKDTAAALKSVRLRAALIARNARRAAIRPEAAGKGHSRGSRYSGTRRAVTYKRPHRQRSSAEVDGAAPARYGVFAAVAQRPLAQPAAYRLWQRWKSPGDAGDKPAANETATGKEGEGSGKAAVTEPKPDPKKADEKTAAPKPSKPTAQQKAAEGALKLAKEVSAPPASLLMRLKQLRRQSAPKMWSVLRSLDRISADALAPEAWWEFRRTEVRHALNQGHAKTAYGIAKTHGALEEENAAEAEFLAGWIALRFLKNPQDAEARFLLSKASSWTARDKARAFYWLGRTKDELGAKAEAGAAFAEASMYFTTYYGGLALQAAGSEPPCQFRAPVRASEAEIAAASQEDIFKSLMILKQLDLQPLTVAFVLELARQLEDEHRIAIVLELAERIAPPHLAIRAAKIAINRGFPMEAYAYPALLPKFEKAGDNLAIEPALLNALTRQESEFHPGSVSGAGARGLMQLMPGTARLVANANKLKYELPRLVSDPSYNVTLGSGFLASLLGEYDGSYILSLAAYNAGPGRVGQWLKEFGDPRDKTGDPIDWVERIPITETRDYVERILESLQLYRCRFERGKAQLQLVRDLNRGRAPSLKQ